MDTLLSMLAFEMDPLELVLRGTAVYWFLFLLFRFVLRRDAGSMGIADIRKKYSMAERACDDVIFSATGVTAGSLLDGVHFRGDFAETETVVMRSKTGTVRRIKTTFRDIGTKGMVA